MVPYHGDFVTGDSIYLPVNTFNSSGASVTFTGTTVKVYKNGSTSTETTTGVTLSKDHDSITGCHLVTIDTTADTAFYSTGASFSVMVQGATVDGQTVNAWIGSFSIDARGGLSTRLRRVFQ